jgi:hypothetical protein
VLEVPEHTFAFPVMFPGIAGAEVTDTANVCAGEEPQILFATTLILPLAVPAVVDMLVVVEVPVHPDGNVHV